MDCKLVKYKYHKAHTHTHKHTYTTNEITWATNGYDGKILRKWLCYTYTVATCNDVVMRIWHNV